jgi:O-antigen ligase
MTVAPLPLVVVGAGLFVLAVLVLPWVGVPLVVLSLPFHLHPRTAAGLEVSVTELAIVLAVAAVLLRRVALRRRDPDSPSVIPSPFVDWCVVLFLGSALISMLVSEYPKQSFRELRWLIVEPIAVFYLARMSLDRQHIGLALWSVVGAGTLAALVALVSIGLDGDLLHVHARATAPYLSPNHLGLFLGRAMPVALAFALFATCGRIARRSPLLAGICFAIMGLALLRTLSIGAWIGVGAATIALTALRGRRWLAVSIVSLATLAVVALVLLPPERTLARLDAGTGTGLFRLQIWSSALHMIADHPLLGIGLDNFLYEYRSEYMLPEAWEEPNISHPHNFVLHFWLQLGLPGLIAAFALLVWAALAAHRRFWGPAGPIDQALAAGVLGILIDFVVHGSVDNSYFLVDAAVIWWLCIALLLIAEHGQKHGATVLDSGTGRRAAASRSMG